MTFLSIIAMIMLRHPHHVSGEYIVVNVRVVCSTVLCVDQYVYTSTEITDHSIEKEKEMSNECGFNVKMSIPMPCECPMDQSKQ